MYDRNIQMVQKINMLGERMPDFRPTTKHGVTHVAPLIKPFVQNASVDNGGVIYSIMKPILVLQKIMGIFPVGPTSESQFKVIPQQMIYSVAIFILGVLSIIYIKWDKVEMTHPIESRFEEAVIDYLFTVYLIPIVINPITLYESKKHAKIFNDLLVFEGKYKEVTGRKMPLFMGNRPMFIAIILPATACAVMIVTHTTMIDFRLLQVVPYCYIMSITFIIGGAWYLQCELLGQTATMVSEDFQKALKTDVTKVADFRALWMLLSKLTRSVGHAYGYTMLFLCLYLFLIITLTVYGLLSQIQEGLGTKDIGLMICAVFSTVMLFFICDEAHYASHCVKVQFQKRLLLVELTWMNEDTQQEVNMFLRATEMNPADMSLSGFVEVNRNLFKSLIATMVTYLVVLLQFQISIPEESTITANLNSTTVYLPLNKTTSAKLTLLQK